MKNIVKMFIFMLLIIANVNLVSAIEEAGVKATGLPKPGAVLHDISDSARDKHVDDMYDFARKHTNLVHRRAKTAAMFEKFNKTYIAPRSKSAGTEERKD
jgi:hypothetical protein